MTISKRVTVSMVSAATTMVVGISALAAATPAGAEAAAGEPAPSPTTSATPPPSSTPPKKPSGPKAKVHNYKRLTKKAKKVANKVRNDWRRIKSIGGWRAGSKYSGDHPAGRAIDVMIPKWKKNAKLGWSIAKYFAKRSNAKKFKIHYVIFRKKIWTVQNPHWRTMSNRGGATANHFDHVHISVKR